MGGGRGGVAPFAPYGCTGAHALIGSPDRQRRRAPGRSGGPAPAGGLGLGRGSIEKRVAAGRLHRIHRGVYAVGPYRPFARRPAHGGRARLRRGSGRESPLSRRAVGHSSLDAVRSRSRRPSGTGRRVRASLAHRAPVPAGDRTSARREFRSPHPGAPWSTSPMSRARGPSNARSTRPSICAWIARVCAPIPGGRAVGSWSAILESHRVGSTLTRPTPRSGSSRFAAPRPPRSRGECPRGGLRGGFPLARPAGWSWRWTAAPATALGQRLNVTGRRDSELVAAGYRRCGSRSDSS